MDWRKHIAREDTWFVPELHDDEGSFLDDDPMFGGPIEPMPIDDTDPFDQDWSSVPDGEEPVFVGSFLEGEPRDIIGDFEGMYTDE